MRKSNRMHGFLGMGKMAEILLRQLLQTKRIRPNQILVSRRNVRELGRISRKLKISATSDNSLLVRRCRFLWIGVKPFQAAEVFEEIRAQLRPGTIILSMMAGTPIKFIQKHLGKRHTVIRLMPNTPALLGEGATGVYFPRGIGPKIRKQVEEWLSGLGEMVAVPRESDLDAVTGLSGSGPAFVYALAEGLMQGGVRCHLSAAVSRKLAVQTLLGAARMLQASQANPQDLIRQVVSKKGTTEAGLKVLQKNKTGESLAKAVVAATKRSREIRKEMK